MIIGTKASLDDLCLGDTGKFLCGFANARECSCDTGLCQVSDVRVWKLQC